jgi:hypothetical protein
MAGPVIYSRDVAGEERELNHKPSERVLELKIELLKGL